MFLDLSHFPSCLVTLISFHFYDLIVTLTDVIDFDKPDTDTETDTHKQNKMYKQYIFLDTIYSSYYRTSVFVTIY